MRIWLLKLSVVGLCFVSCPSQAREISSPASPPDQSKIEALRTEFEQEMKQQLAQKEMDDYSFDEISDAALKAAKKVYGAHPQLMKQQVLFDLQQLPVLEGQIWSNYRVKEFLNLGEVLKAIANGSTLRVEANNRDYLPLFYGRKPEYIAQAVKNILFARHLSARQFGQRTLISQFMPDRTYHMKVGNQSRLVVKTFEDDIIMITVQVTESGLLKPLQVEWLQPKDAQKQPA